MKKRKASNRPRRQNAFDKLLDIIAYAALAGMGLLYLSAWWIVISCFAYGLFKIDLPNPSDKIHLMTNLGKVIYIDESGRYYVSNSVFSPIDEGFVDRGPVKFIK